MRPSSLFLLAAAILCLPFASTLQAQQDPKDRVFMPGAEKNPSDPQEIVTLHQTTRRVLVDVVVTDKSGKPVRGLTQQDFTVLEDGVPQGVLSFDVEDSSAPPFISPKLPPLPANTFVNLPKEPEKGPLYIILYDMVNTEREDQMTSFKPLLEFIDSKPEGSRFAIFVNADGLHLIQGFTSDRESLRAAILSRGPGPHLPNVFLNGANYGRGSTSAMISIFNFLAEYVEGISGRKNLLWLSGSFPIALNADPSHERDADSEDVKRAIAAMARSQVAVYPVDIKGVLNVGRYEGMAQSRPAGQQSNESITKGGVVTLPGSAGKYLQMMDIGAITGGHGFTGNNDLSDLMKQAVDHGKDYYTLSYRPANEKYDGSLRHIEVKTSQKSYQLAYRQIYYALSPDAIESKPKTPTEDSRFVAAKQEDPLYADIEHGAPLLHDLLFRARVDAEGDPAMATERQMQQFEDEPAYLRPSHKNRPPKPLKPVKVQRYRIHYTVLDPQLRAQALSTGLLPTLEFAVVAYDADGRMLNGILNDGVATTNVEQGGKKQYLFRLEQELNVPLEGAWIRIAVRDKLTNRIGTLEVPLPLKAEPPVEAKNAAK